MLLIAVPIENVQDIWPTKMDWANAEIGRKMANGRLLFLALPSKPSSYLICTYYRGSFITYLRVIVPAHRWLTNEV